jgi:hypothetical protein
MPIIRILTQHALSPRFELLAQSWGCDRNAFAKVETSFPPRTFQLISFSHSLSLQQQLWLNFGKEENPPKKRTGHAPPLFFWSHWN